ncbi:MAG TPA: hypothetical protein VFV11_02595 [Solimonas sp.]|nr:hypothetical protein [Solimonas sp.]
MRTPGRQRGAAAVFAGIALLACLASVVLVIDLGRLFFAQRDMQRMANMGALDAARVAGGCFGRRADPQEAAYNEVLASLQRNGVTSNTGVQILRLDTGRMVTPGDGLRYFEATSGNARAVRVVLQRPAPVRLIPLFENDDDRERRLEASAVAYSAPRASVSVNTRLAGVSPPLLRPFADDDEPSLDLVSYRNLLGADVPLGSIFDFSAGTPDEVLESEISLSDFLRNVVTALGATGNAAAQNTAAVIAANADSNRSVVPSQFLFVSDATTDTTTGTLFSAGQLMVAAAQAANGSDFLDVPVDLPPPLLEGPVRTRVVTPGRPASLSPGETPDPVEGNYAANAQGVIEAAPQLVLPLIGRVTLPIWAEAAEATAQVTDIECARSGVPQETVWIRARSNVARIGIGRFDDISAPKPVPQTATLYDSDAGIPVGPLTLPVHIRLRARGFANVPSDDETLEYRSPWPQTQSIGRPEGEALRGAIADLPENLEVEVEIDVLGNSLPVVPAVVDAAVNQARILIGNALRTGIADNATALADALLAPAFSAGGLTLGGADITVHSVDADQPFLFTR